MSYSSRYRGFITITRGNKDMNRTHANTNWTNVVTGFLTVSGSSFSDATALNPSGF